MSCHKNRPTGLCLGRASYLPSPSWEFEFARVKDQEYEAHARSGLVHCHNVAGDIVGGSFAQRK